MIRRSQAPAVTAALAEHLGQDTTIAAAPDEPIEAASARALGSWPPGGHRLCGVAVPAVAPLARIESPGSAFGLLVALQSLGNLAASAIAALWTAVLPRVAFAYLVAWMGPDAGWAAAG